MIWRAAFTWLLVTLLLPLGVTAETIRVATFNAELSRKGPGLLLKDLRRDNEQVSAVIATIVAADADILALQGLDWDHENTALRTLQSGIATRGVKYPYFFMLKPNAGAASGLDLDGDGRMGEPEDAWGWGRFTGQGGIALLSKFPIAEDQAQDFTQMRWQDLPDHRMPLTKEGQLYPDAVTAAQLRLSSSNHWAVPVILPDGEPLWILSFHATPPVFDGPEDRNGRRNADEILLWVHVLNGLLGDRMPEPFVLMGDANNDPDRGEGHKDAIHRLLNDPHLQAVEPSDSQGAHTVNWERTGPMRVDYVLPSKGMNVIDSGILRSKGSRYGLVWVDIRR